MLPNIKDKHCIHCGIPLTDENTHASAIKQYRYVCIECERVIGRTRIAYLREWRRKKAIDSIRKKYQQFIRKYELAKIQLVKRKEALAYVAGVIDGEGSIYLGIQKKRLFIPNISICNNDEKMLLFCKNILRVGYVSKRNLSKMRPKHNWVYSIGKREDIVNILILVRPFLITKQKQADLLFEYCVNRLEIRQPFIERDYEIYRELKALNQRKQELIPSLEQLKKQIHYSPQKFRE